MPVRIEQLLAQVEGEGVDILGDLLIRIVDIGAGIQFVINPIAEILAKKLLRLAAPKFLPPPAR